MCQISYQINNFEFYNLNLPKNGFWGRNFENLTPDSESAPPSYHMCRFLGKMDKFYFFGQDLPKNGFWGRNFENISPDSESSHPRYNVCQFSGKTDNFELFGLNFGKSPYECNILVLITSRVLQRAGWRLKWVEW